MTDHSETAPEAPKACLSDAKLYTLARTKPLLQLLQPTIHIQMALEEEMSEAYPRAEDDGDDTRILILFTNRKGKTLVSKLMDHERLKSEFTLSEFMAGFLFTLDQCILPGEEVDKVNAGLATCLNVALGAVLGIDDDRGMNTKHQEVSKQVVRSIVATVFDDPLDAILVVREQLAKSEEGEPDRYISILSAAWKLKTRGVVADHAALVDTTD